MEDPWSEIGEGGERDEESEAQALDRATYHPEESVEREGDFALSEAIEADFGTLMDASGLFTGDSLAADLDGDGELNIDNLPVDRVAKIDSFTWKLSVAKDEVGEFRVPSLHGDKPVVDGPDPGTPNPAGLPIELAMQKADQGQSGSSEAGFPSDVSELASLVLGAAVESAEQDLENIQAKQEAMQEAKQKIRDQLGSQPSMEVSVEPQPGSLTPEALDDSDEHQVLYGDAEDEPRERAEATPEQDEETPPEPDQDSSPQEARG